MIGVVIGSVCPAPESRIQRAGDPALGDDPKSAVRNRVLALNQPWLGGDVRRWKGGSHRGPGAEEAVVQPRGARCTRTCGHKVRP